MTGRKTVEERIEALESRILNARSVDAARRLHVTLDALRDEAMKVPDPHQPNDYERGYQAGYHAAMRKAATDEKPLCDHKGIGLPSCSTCAPRTRAKLDALGIGR